MATAAKKTKKKAAEAVEAIPAETPIVWSYGIRTWNHDGSAHGGFPWDLTPGARTTAPDFKDCASCGNGLHANKDGWGDWSLLGMDADGAKKVLGIVRWDSALEVAIDGGEKVKAPWMEVVMTSRDASLASIYGFISEKWRARAVAEKCEASATGYSGHASATGYSGHASATGDSGHASATGDRGHASATGDRGHASATGKYGIAANLGHLGVSQASETGAIMLSSWSDDPWNDGKLLAVFAGMVGEIHNGVTIKPNTPYRLRADRTLEEVL